MPPQLAILLSQHPFADLVLDILHPPYLPVHYSNLPSTPFTQSFTLHSTSDAGNPLQFCEDATAWGAERVVLSCDPNRLQWNTVMGPLKESSGRGALWVVEPSTAGEEGGSSSLAQEVELVNFPTGADFHPLGIEILSDTLFVINHQRTVSTIEIFLLSSSSASPPTVTATHQRTLHHPSFTGAPNSLALLSPTSFYLSHDHLFTRRHRSLLGTTLNLFETLASLPLGRVDLVTFSPTSEEVQVKTAAPRIPFANGLALSHSGTTLAVASTSRRAVLLYSRNTTTNALSYRERIRLPFLVDNLSTAPSSFFFEGEEDEGGGDRFIAAGHPLYLPLLLASRSRHPGLEEQQAGSWVVLLSYSPLASFAPSSSGLPSPSPAPQPQFGWTYNTLFESLGGARYNEGEGFGMSTTGVGGGVGRSGPFGVEGEGEGGRGRWMVVTGLYEKGVRILREDVRWLERGGCLARKCGGL